MTDTAFRGPIANMGAMEDSPATVQTEDGPIYSYQGLVIPNLRAGAFDKDGVGPGRVAAFLSSPYVVTVDNIPSTATTTILAAAAAVVSATAMTLVSVAPGSATAAVPSAATGLPFIPFGSTTVQNVIALDFGFTTGTTTAGNSTIVVVDNTMFQPGQWIAIGGAGNSGKTLSQLTQVQTIVAANTTGITVAPSPLGSLTNAPIGSANLWNNLTPPATQFGPAAVVPTAVANSIAAGLFRLFDPLGNICRNVAISGITAAGGAFLVTGFDCYHQAMSETITSTAGTATVYGKKAFKYIRAVTPQFTDATGTYSVGIGDTFGFGVLGRRYEAVDWKWAGVDQIDQTGYLAPDFTSPALATTGDVRGTLQVSAKGAGTGIASNLASSGTRRLTITQRINLRDDIYANPNNTVPFFGVTQV